MEHGNSFFGTESNRMDRLVARALEDSDAEEPVRPTAPLDRVLERPGSQIDRYKLLRVLGEGGMGIVYLAEQTEPVKREVALKVIKPGMDSRRVLGRFEAEEQALALLEHPYVARVYDAGLAPSGRPYFVMEYVKGIPITEHCDRYKLTIDQRVMLFLHVCEAVQHAHQKGIIHRDLKPSNILVTIQDQEMIPKVIDFGVARAVSQPLTDRTLCTEQGQIIGTPEYMSPEQAEMTGQDIDTRSDIYSLGAVLYELLTGVLPFGSDTLRRGSPDHLRQVIREHDPKTPSVRLSGLTPEDSNRIAQHRQVDGIVLRRALRGDLEWIVMKCLEKDRTRRYETASELAMDLKRHLANEPVVARPPTVGYRLQKAWRRNKLLYSAGAAVAVALVVGLALASFGWRHALWERNRAISARADAQTAQASEAALRQRAQQQELAARRRAYAADMILVQKAIAENNLGRAWTLLDRQKPQPGQEDLRGWEWRYLWSQTRPDEHKVFLSGTRRLRSLEYSDDGRLLLWHVQGELRVASVETGQTVLTRSECWLAVFARRDSWLAFAQQQDEGDEIVVWDLAASQELVRFGLQADVHWLGFTPDDGLLLTISCHRMADDESQWRLTTWDPKTGKVRRQYFIERPNLDRPQRAAISPDGHLVAMAAPGSRFRVLRISDGSERFSGNVDDDTITALTFSPDGADLIVASGYGNPAIGRWDVATGERIASLEGHRSYVTDLQFAPNGEYLVSSSTDQTIRLWDWPEGREVAALRGHPDEVDGLAVGPAGNMVASRCRDGSIFLWPLQLPTETPPYRTLPVKVTTHYGVWAQPRPAVFTPDSRSIVAIEPNGALSQWDVATLRQTRRWQSKAPTDCRVILSPDASQAVALDAEDCLSLLDLATGVERTNVLDHPGPIELVWISGNGRHLVTASFTENRSMANFGFWDIPEGRMKRTFEVPIPVSHSNNMGPTGWYFGQGGHVRVWNLAQPKAPPRELFPGERGEVIRIFDVSPDGRLGAATFEEGYIRVWDMETAEPLQMMRVFLQTPHCVVFSPDSRRLVAGSSGHEAVKLWETATWQEVLTLSCEGTMFRFVAFSPDGQTLMARNDQGFLHIWSAPSIELVETADLATCNTTATARW